jgi:RHS repeat-associated protein
LWTDKGPYRYDLQGTPFFYDANNNLISATANGVRHLFTGQQWYRELGLYDLRNRYYSPDIGRFLQADPSGFDGDATNLYRYCVNNPLKMSDSSGLAGGGIYQVSSGAGVTKDGNDSSPYGLFGFSGRGFSPAAGVSVSGVDRSFFPGGGGILTDADIAQASQTPGFMGLTAAGDPINPSKAPSSAGGAGGSDPHAPAAVTRVYIELGSGPTEHIDPNTGQRIYDNTHMAVFFRRQLWNSNASGPSRIRDNHLQQCRPHRFRSKQNSNKLFLDVPRWLR